MGADFELFGALDLDALGLGTVVQGIVDGVNISIDTGSIKAESDNAIKRVREAYTPTESMDMELWANNMIDVGGISSTVSLKYADKLAQLFIRKGLDETTAVQKSIKLVERAGDLAALKNSNYSEMFEEIYSAMEGNLNAFEHLGVDIPEEWMKAYEKETSQTEQNEMLYRHLIDETQEADGYFRRSPHSFLTDKSTHDERVKEVKSAVGGWLEPFASNWFDIENELFGGKGYSIAEELEKTDELVNERLDEAKAKYKDLCTYIGALEELQSKGETERSADWVERVNSILVDILGIAPELSGIIEAQSGSLEGITQVLSENAEGWYNSRVAQIDKAKGENQLRIYDEAEAEKTRLESTQKYYEMEAEKALSYAYAAAKPYENDFNAWALGLPLDITDEELKEFKERNPWAEDFLLNSSPESLKEFARFARDRGFDGLGATDKQRALSAAADEVQGYLDSSLYENGKALRVSNRLNKLDDELAQIDSETVEECMQSVADATEIIKDFNDALSTPIADNDVFKETDTMLNGVADDQNTVIQELIDLYAAADEAKNAFIQTLSETRDTAQEIYVQMVDDAGETAWKIADAFDMAREAQANGLATAHGVASGLAEGAAAIAAQVAAIQSQLASLGASAGSAIGRAGVLSADLLEVSPTSNSNADGLSYVPYNDYLSYLHKGEAVLTAAQADDWRAGRTGVDLSADAIASAVSGAVARALSGLTMQMDGQTVGHLVAPTVSSDIAEGMITTRHYAVAW